MLDVPFLALGSIQTEDKRETIRAFVLNLKFFFF
jgi:hypothetical protein